MIPSELIVIVRDLELTLNLPYGHRFGEPASIQTRSTLGRGSVFRDLQRHCRQRTDQISVLQYKIYFDETGQGWFF